jgi:NADH dehydrogenase
MDRQTSNWRSGPVAITGANGHVGRALRRRLADRPNPARALGRSDDWTAAIRDADAVVHLAGTLQPRRPDTYETANVATAQRCLNAVAGSTARRLILLSYVGADPAAANPYLRTKGRAEQLTRSADVASVVLRSTLIYGDADDIGPSFATYRTRPGGTVWVLGDGRQRVAPIHVDDLADHIIAAALNPAAPTGTFDVSGPTVYTLDGFVQRINPPDVTLRHLPATPARLLARVMPQLTPALVDVLTGDSITANDPDEIAGRFGVTLHDVAAAAAQEVTR